MTPPEDNQRDEPGGPRLDEEALWRSIVENYGERVPLADEAPPEPVAPPVAPVASDVDRVPPYAEHDGDPEHDGEAEHHFVPPVPPPLPHGTPARRIAWAGLFLPPVLMLLAVALRWTLPTWGSLLLVVAFVGGFVFLVASMPRDDGDDRDDGAVV